MPPVPRLTRLSPVVLIAALAVTGAATAGPVHFLLATEAAPDPAGTFSTAHVLVAEQAGGTTTWSGDLLLQYAFTDAWQVTADVASWDGESDHVRWRGVGADLLWCPHLPGDTPGWALDLTLGAGPDERGVALQLLVEHDPGPWILTVGAGPAATWADADGRRRSDAWHAAAGASRAVGDGWRVGGETLVALERAPGGAWRGSRHAGLDLTRETDRWWFTATVTAGRHAGDDRTIWQQALQVGVDF